MYNEVNAISTGQADGQMKLAGALRPRTMRENIDWQIETCAAQMLRLQTLKTKIEAGASLLDIDMNDLRQAMNY